jgi:hypothetical protein
MSTDLQVAEEIARQMGGTRRIAMMTGAKNFGGDANSLSFRLPAGTARDGINHVKVTLDADDTYTVTFTRIGRAPSFKITEVKSVSMIYCDQLVSLFESTTGLYLRF